MPRQATSGTDAILDAFLRETYPLPSDDQLRDWQGRHPGHEDEIAGFAAMMRRRASRPGARTSTPTLQDTLVLAMSRMDEAEPTPATLPDIVERAGETVPRLARTIDVDRTVLADLVAGRLSPPTVGPRLKNAIARALGVAVDKVAAAIQASFDSPRLGHASSDGPSATPRRTYADSIELSAMSPERKAFWLAEE